MSTCNVTWADVWKTQIGLMQEGKFLIDFGKDNVGHLGDGTPVVIDHGSVINDTGSLAVVFKKAGKALEAITKINAQPENWIGKQPNVRK